MQTPSSRTRTTLTGWARVFDLIEQAADAAERLGFNPSTDTTPSDGAATPTAERSTKSPGGSTDDQAL